MRKKAEAEQQADPGPSEVSSAPASRYSQNWAMLIKRVYEVDPMVCPQCGQSMTVISFIQPPQAEVSEKILRHCGLWQDRISRAPPDVNGLVQDLDFGFLSCFTPLTRPSCSREAAVFSTKRNTHPEPDQANELTYQDIDNFLASF
jgi:hypothetical protein